MQHMPNERGIGFCRGFGEIFFDAKAMLGGNAQVEVALASSRPVVE